MSSFDEPQVSDGAQKKWVVILHWFGDILPSKHSASPSISLLQLLPKSD